MSGVYLVTDSSSDLIEDEIEPFDLEIVPLTIRFGADEFTDRKDLSVTDFYQTDGRRRTNCPRQPARRPAPSRRPSRRAERPAPTRWSASPSRERLSTPSSRPTPPPPPSRGGCRSMWWTAGRVSSGLGTLVLSGGPAAPGRVPTSMPWWSWRTGWWDGPMSWRRSTRSRT